MHKYLMGKKLSASRAAEGDLVGMVTDVKATVQRTNGMLGYTNSSFWLLSRRRHWAVLCNSTEAVWQNCKNEKKKTTKIGSISLVRFGEKKSAKGLHTRQDPKVQKSTLRRARDGEQKEWQASYLQSQILFTLRVDKTERKKVPYILTANLLKSLNKKLQECPRGSWSCL